MPDISQITLPSGSTYNLKDAAARAQISALVGGDAVLFVGVSSAELTDGGNESPVVNGETKVPSTGQLYFYGTEEFIYGPDNKWHALGSLDTLGDLAYKDDASTSYTPAGTVSAPTFTGKSSNVTITSSEDASGNYQPEGTVSAPTFTGSATTFTGSFTPTGEISFTNGNKTAVVSPSQVAGAAASYTPDGTVSAPTISVQTAGSTTTIHDPTSETVAKTVVAAAPGAEAPSNAITYYSVSGEVLSLYQLGYTTGDSISTTDVTVKNGDASYQASQPTFTGTGVQLVTENISVPTSASFSGDSGSVSVSGTPNGSNSAPTFTGTKVQLAGTTTADGDISQPTFSGTAATITVS